MPSPKNYRRGGEEKNRKGRLAEKASSFHGQNSESAGKMMLRRPRTQPDLLSGANGGVGERGFASSESVVRPPKLTKLLLNVTIQRSLGAVQVIMSLESTVEDLIAAAVRQYTKEARRPILPSKEPSGFDLHYSQFSLESLNREEKLVALGSRNFFLCPKRVTIPENDDRKNSVATSTASCSKQAEKLTKSNSSWIKIMGFSL